MVRYTQDGSQFSTVLYSEREEYRYIQVYRHLERKPIERLDMREAQCYTYQGSAAPGPGNPSLNPEKLPTPHFDVL